MYIWLGKIFVLCEYMYEYKCFSNLHYSYPIYQYKTFWTEPIIIWPFHVIQTEQDLFLNDKKNVELHSWVMSR